MASRIDEDIRNGRFRQVYLLYGEDAYLRGYYKKKLIRALVTDETGMNLQVFEGKDTDQDEVIAQAQTLPFFAPYRVIVVENSGLFKSAAGPLADFLPQIPEQSILIFSETEVDKRSKLYKAAKTAGVLQECAHLKGSSLEDWAVRRLAKEGKRIQIAAMHALLQSAGDELFAVSNEVDKVVAYTLGRDEVLLSDVEAVCPVRPENHVFRIINAIAEKNRETALDQYAQLLSLRESPIGILRLLGGQFNRILQVKDLREQGFDRAEIARRSGQKEYAVSSNLQLGAGFDARQLRELMAACVRTEEAVKSGDISDRIGVELLIAQAASPEKNRKKGVQA